MENYKINIARNTFVMSAAFEREMQNPESEEYKLIKSVLADFPQMVVSRRSHRTPVLRNQYKNLSYRNMERFMGMIPNSKEYLAQYHLVKELADASQPSPYAYVRDWFIEQFPDYRENPLFYVENTVPIYTPVELKNKIDAAA